MRIPALTTSLAIASAIAAQPGSLDPTFGSGGVVHLDPSQMFDGASAVAALSDNSVLLAGSTWGSPFFGGDTTCGMVIKLQGDGGLLPSFGWGGYRPVIGGERNALFGMAVSAAGIYVAGWSLPEYDEQEPDPDTHVLLARISADGEMDASFSTAGVVLTNVSDGLDAAADLVVQPDGRIVVAGSTTDANGVSNALLLRYNADGSLDETFSGDGRLVVTAWSAADAFEDVAVLDDGSIVGAGFVEVDTVTHAMLVKVDPNGAFDNAFGTGGILMPDMGWVNSTAYGIMALGNDLLICGKRDSVWYEPEGFVARILGSGEADSTFGNAGIAVVEGVEESVALDLAVQSDGKVLLGGTTDYEIADTERHFMLARFNADGTLDIPFGSNGAIQTLISPVDQARGIAIGPDGRILAAGSCSCSSYWDIAVARYLGDACAVFPSVSPEALILCPNSTGELTTGPFDTYQWYKNGLIIAGATSQTLPVTSADDVGSWFKVRTTIDTCFGFSDSVLVDGHVFLLPTVSQTGEAPNLIGDNGEQIYCQGDDPVLVLSAPYDTNVQWSMNGEPIPGADDTLYAVPGSGSYTVEGAPSVCPDFIQDADVSIVIDFHPYVQPTVFASGILLCPQPEGNSAQWYYNGMPVAGIEQCVIPIDAGNYTVFVDYGDSCSVMSAPFTVVGLSELTRPELQASPVPTSDRVTISWSGGGPMPGWRVIDLTGRIVRSGSKSTSPLTIDLASLDVGRYRFLSGDGRSLPLAVTH